MDGNHIIHIKIQSFVLYFFLYQISLLSIGSDNAYCITIANFLKQGNNTICFSRISPIIFFLFTIPDDMLYTYIRFNHFISF